MPRVKRRGAVLLLVLPLAGCGGDSASSGPATSSQPSVVQRAHATLAGGSADLRRASNTRTAVSLSLRKVPRGVTIELDRGSCGAQTGLQRIVGFGQVTAREQSWEVLQPLPQLTIAPLAVVLRRSSGAIVDCGDVPQH
jgi:hypothetical protein